MEFKGRHTYIGASEAAAAIGLSAYKSRTELWMEKTGRAGDEFPTPAMERGKKMESTILDKARQDYEMILSNHQKEFTASDPEWGEWLRCHVDAVIEKWTPTPTNDKPLEGKGILEAKAPGAHMIRSYRDNGLPADYIVQMQVCLMLSGYTWGRYVFLDYDRFEVVAFDVEADADLQDSILKNLKLFWEECMIFDKPPDEETPPERIELSGELVELSDPDYAYVAEQYIHAKIANKESEKKLKVLKEHIAECMGDTTKVATLGNIIRVNYGYTEPAPKVDTDALLEWAATIAACVLEDPDRAKLMAENYNQENFTKRRPPYRTMRITGINDFKGAI